MGIRIWVIPALSAARAFSFRPECYFAILMMGAVLHTINIRLSPERMGHTIAHVEDKVILVNAKKS